MKILMWTRQLAMVELLLFFGLACIPLPVLAHTFPDHTDPKVGATVASSPNQIRIWFDSALEPAFSTIVVKNAQGKVVDSRNGRVSPDDVKLLEVGVPQLMSGSYKVFWSVVVRDGHRTSGDYSFVVK